MNKISNMEKTDLIKRLSKVGLTKKENKLFEKIMEKGINNWNDADVELLTLLHDIHYYPVFNICGCSIYPYEQEEKIRREISAKKELAINKLNKEPYASWFKNARNYK